MHDAVEEVRVQQPTSEVNDIRSRMMQMESTISELSALVRSLVDDRNQRTCRSTSEESDNAKKRKISYDEDVAISVQSSDDLSVSAVSAHSVDNVWDDDLEVFFAELDYDQSCYVDNVASDISSNDSSEPMVGVFQLSSFAAIPITHTAEPLPVAVPVNHADNSAEWFVAQFYAVCI